MGLYRRLLGFLRPHAWRMAAAIASNLVGAVLDAFAFTLLIPFLNALFAQQEMLSTRLGWLGDAQRWLLGRLLDPAHPMESLRVVIILMLVVVFAIFAPLVAPGDPFAIVDRPFIRPFEGYGLGDRKSVV